MLVVVPSRDHCFMVRFFTLNSTAFYCARNIISPDRLASVHQKSTVCYILLTIICQYFFRTPEQEITLGGETGIDLLSPYRLELLLRFILTVVAAALLLVPVFILFKLQPTKKTDVTARSRDQLIIILAFTLAFSVSFSIFTTAKRQEIFIATAAYCAVLVIFLGNTSQIVAATIN